MKKTPKTKRVLSSFTTWRPTEIQAEKLRKLRSALIIESPTGLVVKALGELYERTFPGEKWL